MIKEDVTNHAHFIVARPKENVAAVKAGILIQRVAVIQGQLGAPIIFVELEVNDAGNRVSSIGGRSAIFQNLHALDRRNGKGKQIDECSTRVSVPRKRRDTATIDKNQGSAWVETAQRNGSCASRSARGVRVVTNRDAACIHHRLGLEKVLHGGALARFIDKVAVESKDRVRTHFF